MCTTIQQILWSCLSGYAVMVVSVSLMWLYVSVCSVILHHAHITPRLFNYLSKYSDLCKAAYGWPVIQKCSQVCAIPCCALSGPLHPISCWLTRHFHQHGRQPEIKLHPTTSLCGLLRMWGCFSTCHVSIRSCFTCWSFELGLALQYHVWVCVKPLCWVWHYSTMHEYESPTEQASNVWQAESAQLSFKISICYWRKLLYLKRLLKASAG